MRGDTEIIEYLNEVLTAELTAINQYFVHYKLCQSWGYHRLAAKQRAESIEEMEDAECVMDRILYFEGMPNLQRLNPLRVGETVPEQFAADLALEQEAIERYNRGIQMCLDKGDGGTRDMLEKLLVGEEHHADWIETQLQLIENLGEERYLLTQVHED